MSSPSPGFTFSRKVPADDSQKTTYEYIVALINEIRSIAIYLKDAVCNEKSSFYKKDGGSSMFLVECNDLINSYQNEADELESLRRYKQDENEIRIFSDDDYFIIEESVISLQGLNGELEDLLRNSNPSLWERELMHEPIFENFKERLDKLPRSDQQLKELLLYDIELYREEASSALESLRICDRDNSYSKKLTLQQKADCTGYKNEYKRLIKEFDNLRSVIKDSHGSQIESRFRELSSTVRDILVDIRRLNSRVVDFLVNTPFIEAPKPQGRLGVYRTLTGRVDPRKKRNVSTSYPRSHRRRGSRGQKPIKPRPKSPRKKKSPQKNRY